MKKSEFTDEQIACALKQAERGAPCVDARRCAVPRISRNQISIAKITIWYTHRRALQSGLLPAAPPVVPTLFQKFAT
ncbi:MULTISPECIES: hypothetical protein [Burkholderia]|jgi:hypothetical protein|uniref:Transposase n=2 Tax=Burkholderia contaminans TaxID=488447 RepID=A0ABD7Y7N1_9BURK|nr:MULTISPECIES: hypothetical protein [Burkholderia]UTP26016.1 hypothetical protein NMB33_23170 [Burkholderia sp. FXe9]KKL29286.1 hypothetical protein WR31_37345 [Burkholderia contaminans LMG 23361]MCA7908072.1 hypothetical protein [Burkholderia contaminans]MCA8185066.1 hypothetical protein [Burkholderia contaminans]MCA8364559.1 hypothetical protein [Burkholderia contaminans]